MNFKGPARMMSFSSGHRKPLPGQGQSEDNQQRSHLLALVFLTTLPLDPQNSREAGSCLPGMERY